MKISNKNKIIRNTLKVMANQYDVVNLCTRLLDNDNFFYWSGSSKPENHHYGTGGLAQHTYEVISLCLAMNSSLTYFGKGCNSRQLFLSALYHDVGKLYDYKEVDGVWVAGEHKYKIHHISRSALMFQDEYIDAYGLPDEKSDDIIHAILSHHGLRELGSPVAPQTIMAWILHLCDNMSARSEECHVRLWKNKTS